ncbi:hypothetical protein PGT21_028812 [Puccinia graminis f. sp. tritici]|uniref:Uncharacterized protein n=1 Tax=Puccinia graminis f. sp. tritici TaxID=56615 RepID=A0A5B0P1X0_PUCGR|nr:hypothetical protein PGT21_028812 [Puccinia graminis f. sp. tritici]
MDEFLRIKAASRINLYDSPDRALFSLTLKDVLFLTLAAQPILVQPPGPPHFLAQPRDIAIVRSCHVQFRLA